MFKKIQRFDELILLKVKKLHSRPMTKILKVVTYLGNGAFVWFLLSFPMLIIKSMRSAGINIIFSLLITWLIGEITIKHIVGRVRPSEQLSDEEQLIKRPKHFSFPSGHTASSFAVVAVTLMRCPWWIFVPSFLLASLIGFSRVYFRVHYFTDVAVGFLLGNICGISSVFIFNSLIKIIGVSL